MWSMIFEIDGILLALSLLAATLTFDSLDPDQDW